MDLALAISGSFFFNVTSYPLAVCLVFMAGGVFLFAGYNEEGGTGSINAYIARMIAILLFFLPLAALALSTWFLKRIHQRSKDLKKINLEKLFCFYAFSLFFSLSAFLVFGGTFNYFGKVIILNTQQMTKSLFTIIN